MIPLISKRGDLFVWCFGGVLVVPVFDGPSEKKPLPRAPKQAKENLIAQECGKLMLISKVIEIKMVQECCRVPRAIEGQCIVVRKQKNS